MRLSVVIPALNEERHLGRLLSDIQRQSHRPDEIIVVDAGSSDATVRIAEQAQAVVLHGEPPVARGRTLGGYSAVGDLIFFLDADTRLPKTFFEDFVCEVERRRLDMACPRYLPFDSAPTIGAIHAFWNVVLRVSERTLPSGAGHCIALRSELFRESRGFDPALKFDDIELVRRLSKGRRFGLVATSIFVSDRRYREQGILRTFLLHLLMALAFALGKFRVDQQGGLRVRRPRALKLGNDPAVGRPNYPVSSCSCVMKDTLGLPYRHAHRCERAGGAADFIHPSARKVDPANFACTEV